MWDSASEAAYRSCLLSANSRISTSLKLAENGGLIEIGNRWRSLTSGEISLIYRQIGGESKFDCHQFRFIEEAKNEDGRPLDIWVRKVDGDVEVRLQNISGNWLY